MCAAPIPAHELEPVRDFTRYRALSTLTHAGLDALTLLASQIAKTPIAMISLIGGAPDRFESRVGLDAVDIPRDWAPCVHAVATGEDVVCHDLQTDCRFADSPLVQGPPNLRFYAGIVLVAPRGAALGTLAVIDTSPRGLSPSQRKALTLIAKQIVGHLELDIAYRELAAERVRELEVERQLMHEKAENIGRLAAQLHDGVGQQLTGISMLIGAARREAQETGSTLQPELAQINALLTAAIETCRDSALRHGGSLGRMVGVDGALEQFACSLERPGSPRLVFQRAQAPISCLDDLSAYHLFRIASEAIMNAVSRSGARSVSIRTFHNDGTAGLEVEDDGGGRIGDNLPRDRIANSVMAYRARAIGALLECSNLGSRGLRFRCHLSCGCKRCVTDGSQSA